MILKKELITLFNLSEQHSNNEINAHKALIDLTVFFAVMFLIRETYFYSLGFWGNAMLKSTMTVGVATGLLYFRKQSWKDIGLIRPNNLLRLTGITIATLIGTVISILIFETVVKELVFTNSTIVHQTTSRFSELKDNLPYFFSIIGFVWIESFLEELQDRGFSLNRLNALFSKIPFSAVLAVLVQAAIFGFRHSYDFSPRSVTTGIIGFVFGMVYITTGRNLWPLILAHIVLNTLSMIERI